MQLVSRVLATVGVVTAILGGCWTHRGGMRAVIATAALSVVSRRCLDELKEGSVSCVV